MGFTIVKRAGILHSRSVKEAFLKGGPPTSAEFTRYATLESHVAVGQNPVPLVNIKIGGTWVFIRPKMEA